MPLAESDVKHELRMFFQNFHGYFSPGFKQTALFGNTVLVTRSFTGFEVSTRRGVCRVR